MAEHNPELERVLQTKDNDTWKKWGPYLSERQWGTVREDYSHDGSAWEFVTHEKSRSNAYRWGEDGIGGISDNKQKLCFSVALWNEQDNILKERLFGLTGNEGNHGEDVKELYYYLDSTPTHSYMKMLYKYPAEKFPYAELVTQNRNRNRKEAEFEITDTNIFKERNYFDVHIEYAKKDHEDICIKISITNQSSIKRRCQVLPTFWYRNFWNHYHGKIPRPTLRLTGENSIEAIGDYHSKPFQYNFYTDGNQKDILFCDNETNNVKLYGNNNISPYPKDGINDYIVNGNTKTINPQKTGTKSVAQYVFELEPKETKEIHLRLSQQTLSDPFNDYDDIFNLRKKEADDFFANMQKEIATDELKRIHRQAMAGMLWSKQFYYYDVAKWTFGDEKFDKPIRSFSKRNSSWTHLQNKNIISMPDKWEYPWYAAWDLAFHCVPLAQLDPKFAKRQLALLLREYYMHPNGQIPAYEWNFSDVNPPVHAWAVWETYKIDKKITGKGDLKFLEKTFQKLLMNFTWWVNQKDRDGKNIFDGGFLGLDNIGVFDRSNLPHGVKMLEQADSTSWMAMYALNMLRIAIELAQSYEPYEESASKFFQHFLFIASAMTHIGSEEVDLWNEEDQFFYDVIHLEDGTSEPMKLRSLVGVIPLFAVECISDKLFADLPNFKRRATKLLENRPDLENLVSKVSNINEGNTRLLAIVRRHRLKQILKRVLDEKEFLSEFGIRSLSKAHEENPYQYNFYGNIHEVKYLPGESDSGMFGGNSNWRGPIWFPINYLIITSLREFYKYYGDEYKVEFPTRSGNLLNLEQVADELSRRLIKIFHTDDKTKRPYMGTSDLDSRDDFKDLHLFHEFFHGDNGKGLGASHQTGWTGLVADLITQVKSL